MNILITGGTGFIGNHLIRKLLTTTNHKIFILKRSTSNTWRIDDIKRSINLLDYKDSKNLESIFKKNSFDIIIHLSALYIKYTDNWKDIKEMDNINILLPSILLQLAINNKVKAFINTGSCFEYKLPKIKIKESDPISPYNYYAATKIAFEDLLKYFVEKEAIRGLTIKLFYAYGENDNQKVIPSMITAMIKSKKISLTKGEQKISFTYIGDIVDAYIKAIYFINSQNNKKYEVFNIGSDKLYKLKHIGKMLEQITNKKGLFSFNLPYPKNEVMYISCNYSKANNILNWSPKTNIMDGLKRTYSDSIKDIR